VLDTRSQIVGAETVVSLGLHHLGVAQEEQLQGAPDGAGVDRLPEPVEHENGRIKMAYHAFPKNCRESYQYPPRPQGKAWRL
jgi:hypothetical protein